VARIDSNLEGPGGGGPDNEGLFSLEAAVVVSAER
jgi:hypothetical protein